MKKMFNKFLLTIVLLAGFATMAFGQATISKTGSYSAAGTNSLLSAGAGIYKLTITAGATNVALALFDAPSTALTWTSTTYTNRASYVTNLVSTTVDLYGVTNSVTNAVLYTYTTAVTGAATAYSTIGKYAVAANTTVEIIPVNPIIATRGLLVTNSTACDVTISYSPLQ